MAVKRADTATTSREKLIANKTKPKYIEMKIPQPNPETRTLHRYKEQRKEAGERRNKRKKDMSVEKRMRRRQGQNLKE